MSQPEPLWGEQTRKAVENFQFSSLRMPRPFLHALGSIKQAAAVVNGRLGLLDPDAAKVIAEAAADVASGELDEQFPVDVFQTGSATSTNMNANEVIATIASRRLGRAVHPNDHVNLCQSSNDVIPSAIHISALREVDRSLLPALNGLSAAIRKKALEVQDVVKTGRTHLMDAVPMKMVYELGAWEAQLHLATERLCRRSGRNRGLRVWRPRQASTGQISSSGR